MSTGSSNPALEIALREAVFGNSDYCKLQCSSYSAKVFPGSDLPVHSVQPQPVFSFEQELAQLLLTEASPDQLFLELAVLIGRFFKAESCLLELRPTDQSPARVACWSTQHPANILLASTLPSFQVMAQAVVAANGPLLISPLSLQHLIPSWSVTTNQGLLAVAIHVHGNISGVIFLSRSLTHPWMELEAALLTKLCCSMAVVLSNLHLKYQVYREAQYQTLFSQLTTAIQNATDLSQVMKLAVDGTAQVMQVDQAMILRLRYWDPRHNNRISERLPRARAIPEYIWSRKRGTAQMEPLEPEDLDATIDSQQRSFWITDCALCRQAFDNPDGSVALAESKHFPNSRGEGIAPIFNPQVMPALLMVPLESKKRLLGFLVLQHSQPRPWQTHELQLAKVIGAQVSSAILQTETLRQVESLVEERTAQLQQSLELQAKLYEITRRQIEKLRDMNRRMDEFLSTLSHELRTPLTSMTVAIRMLRQADLPADRRERYLTILEEQCAQETSLINDLLALQELETKQIPVQRQRVNLEQLIQELGQSFQQKWVAKGLDFSLEFPPTAIHLQTDQESLHRVLLELLTNAGKYSDPGSLVRCTVDHSPTQVRLTLTNIGAGISADELPFIFEKFRRCRGATDNAIPGTGLGLALVKSLIQHLDGTIEVSSEPLDDSQLCETCFTMTLPLLTNERD